MKAKDLYPEAWSSALSALKRNNQSLLITGRPGLGKTGLAIELIEWLLCEAPIENREEPCNQCVSCGLNQKRQHPDWQWLTLPRKMQDILPWWGEEHLPQTNDREQIRMESLQLKESFFNLASTRAGARVLLVHPADSMNRTTANALLKTLEEPSRGLQFILLSDYPARLPATIKSRCRQIALSTPDRANALQWLCEHKQQREKEAVENVLAMSGGAPVLAYRWLDQEQWLEDWRSVLRESSGLAMMDQIEKLIEPMKKAPSKAVTKKTKGKAAANKTNEALADTLAEIGLEESLDILQRLFYDVVLEQFQITPRYQPQSANAGKALGSMPPALLHKVFHLMDEIIYFRKHLIYNLNAKQVFERLLLQWAQIRSKL